MSSFQDDNQRNLSSATFAAVGGTLGDYAMTGICLDAVNGHFLENTRHDVVKYDLSGAGWSADRQGRGQATRTSGGHNKAIKNAGAVSTK